MFKYLKGDKFIWWIVIALTAISLLVVYSSTEFLAYKTRNGNTEFYLFKHFLIIVFGFVLMFLCHQIRYSLYKKIGVLLLILSIPLLLLTLLYGTELNQARRWIEIPLFNLSFQPADLAKLAMVMFTAYILSSNQNKIANPNSAFYKITIPLIVVCGLIAPADLSSAALLFITCFMLMFIGRVRLKHLFGGVVVVMFLGISCIGVASLAGYSGRIDTWKNRIVNYVDNQEEVWQTQQSKIAIASGGTLGNGPGHSEQSRYLPHPYSDFIYSIIIEEYGLLGGIVVVFLYVFLLLRTVRIFYKMPNAFGAILAVGLCISLVVQAFMNMAVTVQLLPVTGLVLPFISMGGTSLVFTSISIGIILSVSRYIEDDEKPLKAFVR